MMAEDADFLRPLVRTVIQEFLQAEMAEAVGAKKGEREEGRLRYRSGYYPRSYHSGGQARVESPSRTATTIFIGIFERYQRSEKAPVQCNVEL